MVIKMSKIGILGGAFNPMHNGHLLLAQTLRDTVDADKILLIPTHISPHKEVNHLASGEDRLNMCTLASQKYEYIEVCDLEIKKGGISYTAETLRSLKEIYPFDELFLFCGADMFITLETWRDPSDIFKLACICTVPRGEIGLKELQKAAEGFKKYDARCIIVSMNPFPASSSEIRDKIQKGEDVSSLIDEKVLNYINEKQLYKG